MANLPAGNFITNVAGKQCTAVPRSIGGGGGGGGGAASSAAAVTTTAAADTTTSTPPPAAETTAIQPPPVVPPVAVPTSAPSPPSPPTPPNPPSPPSSPPPGPLLSAPAPPPPPGAAKTSSSTSVAAAPPSSTPIPSPTSLTPVESPTSVVSPIAVPVTTSAPELSSATTKPLSISSSVPLANLTPRPVISSESTASKSTTPTTSFGTPLAQLQSDLRSNVTPSPTTFSTEQASKTGLSSLELSLPTSSSNSVPGTEASATDGGISSNPKASAAPLVGGLLGAMGFIAGIALLFFFLKKRRARRDSLLTPMDSGAQNDFYRDEKSQRPAQFDEKWDPDMTNRTQGSHIKISAAAFTSKVVGIGATIKAKVIRNRSASPSVNLNRGNSQFLDGPIPQHSRNNSMLSGSTNKLAAKDRFTNWISRIRDGAAQKIGLRKASKPFDPFAGARTGSQKQTQSNPQPDFSQLLGMDDRELQLESERRRANLGKTQSNSSLPPLGSLGLSFSTMKDVFADPVKAPAPNSNPFTDPIVQPKYPFGEPVSTPQPSMAKQNTYVADVRRSRGQSLDAGGALLVANTRPPSGEPVSRYPSSIAPSHDSYRDTVFSSFSANVRKGKGRSDPFDLERPELWQPPNSGPPNPRASGRPRGASISNVRGSNARLPPLTTSNLRTQDPSGYGQPRVVSQADASRNSNTGTYESKYSSGVSSLDAWGDPGPDLGPGSTNTSMRGNVSSNGGSQDFGRMGVGAGDVSPLSVDSGRENKNRVGTAM